ncbi:hypothetical protein [Nocardia vulneris]|uniref:hypothetical protein n=1 Tax=Nocardia vulneris TaxID=1141657 RepID=UPI00068DA05E|nr:hypothetical protein [Nocardia vulneris]
MVSQQPARSARTRPPVPATLWSAGPDPLDLTQPWPRPILVRALHEFSRLGDRVILLPLNTATPGSGAAVMTVVEAGETDRALTDLHAEITDASTADLIVTDLARGHTDPAHLHATTEWAATRLRAGGLLVVSALATHTRRGLLCDPTGAIVTAAQSADLLYLQHIITAPVDRDAITPALPAGSGPQRGVQAHRIVHVDVLVFLQPSAQAAERPSA